MLLVSSSEVEKQECSREQHGCALLLSVRINPESFFYQQFLDTNNSEHIMVNFYGTNAVYTIVASSQVSTLQGGQPVIGYATSGIMSYYKFVVTHPVKLIQLVVIPLSTGDPDLYVKRQTKSETGFPTIDSFHWVSVTFRTDVLVIQSSDPQFNDSLITGEYIVGVLGFQECTFSLEVTFANISLYTP